MLSYDLLWHESWIIAYNLVQTGLDLWNAQTIQIPKKGSLSIVQWISTNLAYIPHCILSSRNNKEIQSWYTMRNFRSGTLVHSENRTNKQKTFRLFTDSVYGFHTFISFLGSIGMLIKGSGLEYFLRCIARARRQRRTFWPTLIKLQHNYERIIQNIWIMSLLYTHYIHVAKKFNSCRANFKFGNIWDVLSKIFNLFELQLPVISTMRTVQDCLCKRWLYQ